MNDNLIGVAISSAAGSLASGLLGWLDAGGSFDRRKFAGNVIRSLVAGMSFALGQALTDYTGIALYFYAFLGGAGVDVILNRAQARLTKRE